MFALLVRLCQVAGTFLRWLPKHACLGSFTAELAVSDTILSRYYRVILKGPSLTRCKYSRNARYTMTDSPHVTHVTCSRHHNVKRQQDLNSLVTRDFWPCFSSLFPPTVLIGPTCCKP